MGYDFQCWFSMMGNQYRYSNYDYDYGEQKFKHLIRIQHSIPFLRNYISLSIVLAFLQGIEKVCIDGIEDHPTVCKEYLSTMYRKSTHQSSCVPLAWSSLIR